ncbi:MAG: TIGR04282 family arsenosugar biosynthesis glycosyltransferase [Rhodothermales bacterium]|nr:TIGR04282 family arsenosugar biosynthesis glycosyltransferase [Rhodothermales bacterium]MBO6781544.1 TIGR04282 family arsenosugar biosynthesis glycosyltransferase [Rhodothermales bacterium]
MNLLMVFARAPERGAVKTRLARALGEDQTLRLYEAFVRDCAALVSGLDVPVWWWAAGDPAVLAGVLPAGADVRKQVGDGLGARLEHAFRAAASAGFERTLVIGTDSPGMPRHLISEAFDALDSHRAVLGPAEDGGYYLLGLRGTSPEFLSKVTYSRSDVLEKTRALLTDAGTSVGLLPPWFDVDEPADLQRVVDVFQRSPERAPATVQTLRALGLMPAEDASC